MTCYTVNLKDTKTGEQLTTQERATSQTDAEQRVAVRIVEDNESLAIIPKR